jgi:arginyl-tRNA synthetase
MKPVIEILEERISTAIAAVTGLEKCSAIVRPATDPKFGDYQVNGVMAIAKQLKTNPRKLAEEVLKILDVSDLCEPPEIAGPGFINLRLKAEFIGKSLLEAHNDKNLGLEKSANPQTIVVDFSGPNIAKDTHVGHLRSTIIGDCICRLLECLGHNVIRQNHIGDWGTQFGKVIIALWHICMAEKVHNEPYYKADMNELRDNKDDPQKQHKICLRIRDRHNIDYRNDQLDKFGDGERYFGPFLNDLENNIEKYWPDILIAYQFVNLLDDILSTKPNNEILVLSRKKENGKWIETNKFYESLTRYVTKMLQSRGTDNEQEYKAWSSVKEFTMQQCNNIYKCLNVTLEHPRDTRGESYYNPVLPDVVETLKQRGLVELSEEAFCVFPSGFKNKEGQRLPFIIQKSDGAFLYATTDLAAIRYRVNELKADSIIYVTDSRQKLHFEMLFAVAKMAGWDVKQSSDGGTAILAVQTRAGSPCHEYMQNSEESQHVEFVHVMFGSVLGENGQPLKTRSGENVKLRELLDEAVERAKQVVEKKNPELPQEEKNKIAKAVGIGAVKYADYSNNRTSDYVFSFDKMLAMEGNTSPYMQYAYARIKSIERKARSKGIDVETEIAGVNTLNLTEPAELDLAKHLIRYSEAIQSAVVDYRPNYLTAYLYELAQKFSSFYTSCPVIDAGPDIRPMRLLLCDLTASIIEHGLRGLLGIDVIKQM